MSGSVSLRFTVRTEADSFDFSKLCVCRESRFDAMRVRVAQKGIFPQTPEYDTLETLAVGAVGGSYTIDTQTN